MKFAGAVAGLSGDDSPVGIETEDLALYCGKAIGSRRLREQQGGAGVGQHEGEALLG